MYRVPELDVADLSAAYEHRVRSIFGGQFPDALKLQGHLDPRQWELEFGLAGWIGEALDVPLAVCSEIALSNVLGLVSLRLADDARDHELPHEVEPAAATSMSEALYDAARDVYERHLAGHRTFWAALDRWMREWQRADAAAERLLGKRGAPLKISALALCILGGRPEEFRALDRCLDHALTGMVLYDHFCDWREDDAAGRWNAFSTRARQTPHVNVVVALLTTDVVAGHFAAIDMELRQATVLGAKVPRLAEHLEGLRGRLRTEGRTASTRNRTLGIRAQRLFFGDYPRQGERSTAQGVHPR